MDWVNCSTLWILFTGIVREGLDCYRRCWPYLWIDATCLKLRRRGRSVAVIIAVGVNADGRREVLGMEIGTSKAEPIWTEFLRKLPRRGPRGVKLVVSDAHEGLKAAVTKISATWQRCRNQRVPS